MENTTNNRRPSNRSQEPRSRLFNLEGENLLSDASSIIENAVSILEEEIAAGIIAANKLEDNVVDSQKIRSSNPDELMMRFRGDAHEVVDIVMDLLTHSTESLRGLNNKIARASGSGSSMRGGQMILLQPEKAVSPGSSTSIPLMLENDSTTEEMEVSFRYPDLINPDNEKILRRNINFDPATLIIAPASKSRMNININVPKSTKVGTYNMTIRDKKLDDLKAMIEIKVEK